MKRLLLFLLFLPFGASSQIRDTSIFAYPITLDSVVIHAQSFNIAAFIRRVQNDTTFYKAFRSLHLVSFTATNDIKMLGRKNEIKASLYSHTRQENRDGCRSMKVLDEQTTGKFYERNGDYSYYTAGLYAYLFFTKGTVCNENDVVAGALQQKGSGQMEKAKWQLKQLIFNPGSHIKGIPFIGDKAAIFDPEIAKMYDFKLSSADFNGEPCYLFQIIPKKEYAATIVYNELSTWFRKSDYSIIARNYSLSYHTLFFDFDVNMKVRLAEISGRLLPVSIQYDGNWHIITKSRERAKFSAKFAY